MDTLFRTYKRVGNGRGSTIYFDVTASECPPDDELMDAVYELQVNMGYHPGGYGGPNNVKVNKVEIAKGLGYVYEIKWSCFGSCD